MPLYEERLSHDLAKIRSEVEAVGAEVQKAQQAAVQSVLNGNRKLANLTILGDHAVNRQVREINRLCHAFLAVHLPSAGHLRLISSILALVNELERIGDYAATIAREALQLPHMPTGLLKSEIENMAGQAENNLRKAMMAFNQRNVDLAKETRTAASQAKTRSDTIFDVLVMEKETSAESVQYLFDILIIVGRLKRISDRAKNICEETIFSITGETKPAKVYDILFLDRLNNCQSQIAQAVARRAFPNSAHYESAGRTAGEAPAPGLERFLEEQGLLTSAITMQAVDNSPEKLANYDVVVCLDGAMDEYLTQQPFRTVFLEWDIDSVAPDMSEEEAAGRYPAIYREIMVHVRELMEALRGAEAD
jgi:phosphate transport system protein